MPAWPSIEDPEQVLWSEYYQKGQIRTEFENGAVQSRARATSGRWVFIMGWNVLSNADYTALVAFFDANIGGTFTYTHPFKDTSHTCRFSDDKLPEAKIFGARDSAPSWQLTGLQIEEA